MLHEWLPSLNHFCQYFSNIFQSNGSLVIQEEYFENINHKMFKFVLNACLLLPQISNTIVQEVQQRARRNSSPPPFFQWPLITEYVIESSSKLAPKFKEKSKYIPAHAKYEMLALLVNQHPKQEPAQYTY